MVEIFLVVCLVLLAISVYFNIKLGIIIVNIQDSIEECLDSLDEKYFVFSKILEKPVFFDSVEIRQVIQEIKSSQELILKIANKLSNSWETVKNEKDNKE